MAAGKEHTRDGPDMVAVSLGAAPGLAREGAAWSAPGGGRSSLLPELASLPSGTGSTISAGAERLQGTRRLSNLIVPDSLAAKQSIVGWSGTGGNKAALLSRLASSHWHKPSLQVLSAQYSHALCNSLAVPQW